MPLTLPDESDRTFLEAVLRGESPSSAMRTEYFIGQRDLTEIVSEAEWGRQDDERPAQELILRVKESIDPDELINRTAYVFIAIANLRIRQYTGIVRKVTTTRTTTQIECATGGYWLDRQRFPGVVSYADVAPSEVIRDCVGRMERYDLRYMDFEHVPGPKMRRDNASLFDKRSKLANAIGAAVQTGELFFTDNSYNAPTLQRDRSAAEALDVVWEYEVGRDIGEFLPEVLGDEYYSVVAYRDINGIAGDLFEPIRIEGSTAPVDCVYEIEVTDESPAAGKDAYSLAGDAAARFAGGEATVGFEVRWVHPLIVDGDFIGITEPFTYGSVSGTKRWIAKVVRQRKTHDKRHLFESVEMVRSAVIYDETPRVPAMRRSPRGARLFPV